MSLGALGLASVLALEANSPPDYDRTSIGRAVYHTRWVLSMRALLTEGPCARETFTYVRRDVDSAVSWTFVSRSSLPLTPLNLATHLLQKTTQSQIVLKYRALGPVLTLVHSRVMRTGRPGPTQRALGDPFARFTLRATNGNGRSA